MDVGFWLPVVDGLSFAVSLVLVLSAFGCSCWSFPPGPHVNAPGMVDSHAIVVFLVSEAVVVVVGVWLVSVAELAAVCVWCEVLASVLDVISEFSCGGLSLGF